MLKRNLIFGLLIILVIALYYVFLPSDEMDNFNSDFANVPTYQSKMITTTVYDVAGVMVNKIIAQRVSHYSANGDTYFQYPDVTLFTPKGMPSWQISAHEARLTKTQMLHLTGEVKVINLQPNSQLERILASRANVDLTTQTVTSSSEVMLEGPGFYSTGSKLKGDLKKKTAELLENVKTFYSKPGEQ